MNIQENIPLSAYTTMRLGGKARYFIEVDSENDIEQAALFAKQQSLPLHVLGGGSNTIFTDNGFAGVVLLNKVPGINYVRSEEHVEVTAGAGENWDDVVEKSVELGFADIAALSLIPGTCGGAPVQNIGAYGQQISDSLISVRAYDTEDGKWKNILRRNCNFSYRTSCFNTNEKGRYIITQIKMRLSRKKAESPFYKDVESYLLANELNCSSISPKQLREAVITIRSAKLPDPKKVANTGSFFKNPVISTKQYKDLLTHYPQLKAHETDDGNIKLYAGQLIELAGLKNYHDKPTGMATWKNQALVLINEHAKTTADLLAFKQKIVTSVYASFGITLEQEPELI